MRSRSAAGGSIPYELIDAAADAADALDSSVFFVVALPDRLLVRIESGAPTTAAAGARLAASLAGVPVEVERVEPGMLLDVEMLSRQPARVQARGAERLAASGRRILTVVEG
jgi:hypothetical protein